jgi:uncharacterized metal-binding protein YceD (DUF177 family)
VHRPETVFLVPLFSLVEGGNRLELVGTPEELGIASSDAELDPEIRLAGDFYRADTHVEVQARVTAVVHQVCDRCVGPAPSAIDAPLRLYCERRGLRDSRSEEQVRAEDVGLLYYDGRTIDLREEIRQVVLLEVPWHPLCAPDCKGLCPRCGENLNIRDCGCPPERGHGPWDALREAWREP